VVRHERPAFAGRFHCGPERGIRAASPSASRAERHVAFGEW
jgi:hypothetical protein